MQPTPASLTMQPNSGDAITLIQGAGVDCAVLEHDDVLAGRGVEAAEAVVELRAPAARTGAGSSAASGSCRTTSGSGSGGRSAAPVELQLDGAAVAFERGARDRAQQVEHVGVHLVDAAEEDAAGLVEQLQRVAGAHEQPQPVVELVGVAGRPRVEDDEVGDEPLVPPVLVGEQRLAHERRVLELLDAHEQDRQVAARCRSTTGPTSAGRSRRAS